LKKLAGNRVNKSGQVKLSGAEAEQNDNCSG